MKATNPRSTSFFLLFSLFLQSCGVEPIAVRPGEHTKAQDSPTVSGSPNYFTIPPEPQGRGEEALQVRSANTSPGTSRPASRAGSPAEQQANGQDQLIEYIRSDKITSTEQLISAFDNPQPYAAQEAILQAWLRAYVERFQSLDFFKELTETALINHLEEYKELSRLHIKNSESRRELLRNYFHSLYDRIFYEATGHREKPLMQTFVYVLRHIDAGTFVPGDVAKLQTLLTEKLLPSVDPSKTTFTDATYETHGPTLEAIYEILRIIRIVDPTHWNAAENSLYQRTKQQLAAIVEGNQHYPTCYHAHVLGHSLDQCKEEENIISRLGHGIRGVYALYKLGVAVQGLIPQVSQPLPDFESIPEALEAFRECYGHFREATAGLGRGATFYDHHQALQLSGALIVCTRDVATCRGYYDNFKQHLIEAERFLQAKNLSKKEDRTALRYLTVRQLTLIAVKSHDADIRQESLAKLAELGTTWTQHLDADREPVVYELLNGLALIHSAHENQACTPALDALKDLLGRLGAHSRQQHARSISSQWLGGSDNTSIKDRLSLKLDSLPTSDISYALGALFDRVKEDLLSATRSELPISQAQALLKARYRHPEFTKMVSFLEETPMFVQDIECHLKLNEQAGDKGQADQNQLAARQERTQWVKKPIALEDLFKSRSIKPGVPAQDIKKALLVGEAGTGKTSLTKKLAHDWAAGKWGQTFDAVYVLPVRNLRQDKYNGHSYLQHETLATAIANECFTGMREEEDFARLRKSVEASLKESTTLLILDGLDERLGTSSNIIDEAKHGPHKLLLTSRPYGIEAERSLVDIEVDHMGLDTSQRDRFVHRTLDTAGENTADKLLSFIQHHYLTYMSQVPVNLLILCSLWKARGAELQKPGTTIGLPGLYRELVNYVWERFERKGSAHQAYFREAERKRLFRDLEKIALTTLQRGEIIIDPSVIQREVLGRLPSPLLKDAGFLLFEKVSWQYQFPHLTFHEYFAGRRLARQFLSGDPDDLEEVTDFLRSCMYLPRYRRTLSFMAGEIVKGIALEMKLTKKSLGRIQRLLRLVGQAPRELVGVQHLVFQLRLLNEWLLTIAGERYAINDSLTILEQEFTLGNRLNMWLKEALRQYKESKVLFKTLMDLLGETSGIVKNYSDKLLPPILNALQDSNSDVRRDALQALPTLVEMGADVQAMLTPILNALQDSHWSVRSAALQALPTLVEMGADVQAMLTPILNALQDSDSTPLHDVRRDAREALPTLVEMGADVQLLVTPILNALKDSVSDVRSAALQALRTLVEKGADVQDMLTPILNALQDRSVRSAALQALPTLVEKGADVQLLVTPILNDLQDSVSDVRSAALQALPTLVEMGADVQLLVTPILNALKDIDYDVRSAALQALPALVEMGADVQLLVTPILNALKDSVSDVRRDALQALPTLVEMGADVQLLATPILNALKDINAYVRSATLQALPTLVEMGADVQLLVTPILNALQDSDYDVRSAALQALPTLVEMGADVQLLVTSILNALKDSHSDVRSAALQALPTLVEMGADVQLLVTPILNALKDSHSDVRSAALQALPTLVEMGADVQLMATPILNALQDSDYDVRSAAREVLPTLVDKGTDVQLLVTPILNVLKDRHSDVRRDALQALPTLVEKGADVQLLVTPILNALQDSDPDDFFGSVRRAAREALPTLVEMGADVQLLVTPILSALKDSDPDDFLGTVRIDAREALRTLVGKGADVQAMLTPILNALQDSDSYVRRAALEALPTLVEMGADVQAMLTHILNALQDSDSYVRRDALQALPTLVEKGADVQAMLTHILNALQDSDSYVRRDALQALPTLVEMGADVQAMLTPILNALQDSVSYVRRDALRALPTLVEMGADVQAMLTPILNVLQDSDSYVRRDALKALEQMPTKLLISAYWETRDVDLTLLLVPRLYDVALAVEDINSDQRQLILYPTIGDAVKWIKSKQEVQALGELIFQRFLAMFFEVAAEGHLEIVSYLLAHGANIETRHNGQTLLHFFAQQGNLELVKLICDKGAKLEARDSQGRTPIWIATQRGHFKIVSHLSQVAWSRHFSKG